MSQNINILGNKYLAISTERYCGHTDGKYPTKCSLYVGDEKGADETLCKAKCDDFTWCIGYSFKDTTRGLNCDLITTSRHKAECEAAEGCNKNKGSLKKGNTASTSAELTESTYAGGWNCMAKGNGINHCMFSMF